MQRLRKKIRYYSGGKRQGSVQVPHAQCPYIKKFIIRDCNQHYPICPSYFDNIQLVTCITLLTTINPWQAQLVQQMLIVHNLAIGIIDWGGRGKASYLEVGILMAL
ncbi:hypothetical protein [Nostoc sp. CHAB 5836]|uniref:hypothetical protein n=1 Tax=Nostoc sp. CHAB 5836 TaxID=2780404 RepID=UPI001E5702D6|nr:hypothetical protein [Nostoc sp. CHAB 5836]